MTRITIFTETRTYDFKNVSSYSLIIEDEYLSNKLMIDKIIKLTFTYKSESTKETRKAEFDLTKILGYAINVDDGNIMNE